VKRSNEAGRPWWLPIGSFRISDLAGERAGGAITQTTDVNPEGPTFGDVRWAMRLPGGIEEHGS